LNSRQQLRLQLERKGKEVRLQLGLSVMTCSCPAELADTLEQGLAAEGLRVFRETHTATGHATLNAYRFHALPEAQARAFQRFTNATHELGTGEPEMPPDASKIIADAIAHLGTPPPGWDADGPPVRVAVFDTATMTRNDVELLLLDERDADAVLPVLARAWGRERREIEIKPPASWGWGYEAYRPRD
jgi:hypothetical protein